MVTTLTLHIAFENRSTFDEAYMDNILYLTLKMFVLNVLLLLISFNGALCSPGSFRAAEERQ